jgi:hypothetical protein
MPNSLNSNDIFPIIDSVNRLIRKNANDGRREVLSRETLNKPAQGISADDRATRVVPIRGGSNYDATLITSLLIHYESGAVMTVELIRGANPPVPANFPDSEYINNVLISGVKAMIQPAFGGTSFSVVAEIIRESGYGAFLEVRASYG